MTVPFMKAYSELVVQTCHKRGIHAIGGMAAQVPIRHDPEANAAAIAKVQADKEREVSEGYDGTWVAHPGLVPVVMEIFDRHMPGANQIDRVPKGRKITSADLLNFPSGDITEAGLRLNLNVSLRYLEAWLRGTGCVAINYLMEDAATVEISRSQIWQWIRRAAKLSDGRVVTLNLVRQILQEEMAKIRTEAGEAAFAQSRFEQTAQLLDKFVSETNFIDFITLVAYDYLD